MPLEAPDHRVARVVRPVDDVDELARQEVPDLEAEDEADDGGDAEVERAMAYAFRRLKLVVEPGGEVTSATFQITAYDAVGAPRFERAALALGSLNTDGTVELIETLAEQAGFTGQDGDLSPFFFNGANGLGRKIENRLRKDPALDLFVVLEALDDPQLRPGGAIPPLLALELGGTGNSFFATNDDPLAPIGFNWLIQLVLTP